MASAQSLSVGELSPRPKAIHSAVCVPESRVQSSEWGPLTLDNKAGQIQPKKKLRVLLQPLTLSTICLWKLRSGLHR